MTIPIINELAELAASHKLVPFLGAGCSAMHLGLDWDVVRDELALAAGSSSKDHLLVAKEFEDKFGRNEFCNYLKKKLLVETFDDARGVVPLQISSLNLGVIYTTNQDNVFEKCVEKYGRRYCKIVQLEDLASSMPGDYQLIMYHGDLDNPDSVVFTTDDYRAKMENPDHFLNIKLRADLLARNLLFLGYSIRDINIQQILEELQVAFGGKLPKTYLIAFVSNDTLEERCKDYGIVLVDPMKVIPGATMPEEAFFKFVTLLVNETVDRKTKYEIDDLFHPRVPPSKRVVTPQEVNALKEVIDKNNFQEACKVYRGLIDDSIIPKDIEDLVAELFVKLASKVANKRDLMELSGSAFNLHLQDIGNVIKVHGAQLASSVVLKPANFYDIPLLGPKNMPGASEIVCLAIAIDYLEQWNRTITEEFLRNVSNLVEYRGHDLTSAPEELRQFVRDKLDKAWAGKSMRKLDLSKPSAAKGPSFRDIFKDISEKIPKKLHKPYD